jgi:hypothetical protein
MLKSSACSSLTQLFTLQLLPLETDVHFLTIQQKYILYTKRTQGCEQQNFTSVIVTPEKKLMSFRGFNVVNKNESRKNGGHFISFYLENRPRDQIL